MKEFEFTYRDGSEFHDGEKPTVSQLLAHALKHGRFERAGEILVKAVRRTICPWAVNDNYMSSFYMTESQIGEENDNYIEHTIPLGNLLLHTAEGRIVGIEIFERANEILGTWEEPEDEDDWEDRPVGGRWFMQKEEGTYVNRSKAEIEAEEQGCEECSCEEFREERRELNDEKELLVDVKCQECGWVYETVKR